MRRKNTIAKIKEISTTTPETLPLSSAVVDSAIKAMQDGNPNPKEKPIKAPKTGKSSSIAINGTGRRTKIPKLIQSNKNFLRLTLSAIKLPRKAEITVKERNNKRAISYQKDSTGILE